MVPSHIQLLRTKGAITYIFKQSDFDDFGEIDPKTLNVNITDQEIFFTFQIPKKCADCEYFAEYPDKIETDPPGVGMCIKRKNMSINVIRTRTISHYPETTKKGFCDDWKGINNG